MEATSTKLKTQKEESKRRVSLTNEFTNGKHKRGLHSVRKILNFSLKNRPIFEMNKILVRKTPKIDVFRSCWLSRASVFFTFSEFSKDGLWGCHLWLLRASEIWSEAVRCHKWACQKPHVTPSEATSDNSTHQKSAKKSIKITSPHSVSI